MRTVVGLFENLSEANATLDELEACGIAPEQVSVIAPMTGGEPRDTGLLHLKPIQLRDGQRIAAQGPLTSMLTPSTAASSGDLIVASLVRMGVAQDEAIRYVEGVRQGLTLEAVTVDDAQAQEAFRAMQEHGVRGAEGEVKIPVIEEQLRVGKREVPSGGVRVGTYVVTTPVEEPVTLREERVDVQRRPANRPADASAFQEKTFEVTAMAEEPVVAKEARVVEEVVVKKDVTQEKRTIRDRVRKTDVRVEPLEAFDETAYRTHFDESYAGLTDEDYRYEQVLPAYRFGHALRSDERYAGRDWNAIESDVRTAWEAERPGTWSRFKAAVRHAWERAKD
jgi:uncharacterized protein (TIGR02271 family)